MEFFKLLATNIRVQCAESLRHASMPGAKFLLSTERSLVKCVWTLIFLTNYTITWIIMVDMFSKFLSRATITVIELNPQGQPLEFPAVFVCPKQAMNDSLLQDFVLKIKATHNLNMSHNALRNCLIALVNPQHERNFAVPHWQEFSKLVQSSALESSILQRLIKVGDYLRGCYFKGTAIPCDQYFYPDITEVGYCFVFNNVNVKDMQFANMINYVSIDTLIRNNRRVAVLYEYDTNWDLSFEMLEHTTPFLIYLKSTSGALEMQDRPAYVWSPGRVFGYQFEIQESHCADDVRTLLLSQRNCLFSDEVAPYAPYQLHFSHHSYNQDLCINLCHAIAVFKRCNCVPGRYKLQFPKLNYTICRVDDYYCYAHSFNMLKFVDCDLCPKKCRHIKYIGGHEIRQKAKPESTVMVIKPVAEREELISGVTENNKTYFPINIALEKWPRLRHTTNIIFGWTELLISLGGICGLLFGFSFISFIEKVYFCSMRLVCTYRMNKEALQLEKEAKARADQIPCIDLALELRARKSSMPKN